MVWEKVYRFGTKRCLSTTKLKKKKLNTPVKGKEVRRALSFAARIRTNGVKTNSLSCIIVMIAKMYQTAVI